MEGVLTVVPRGFGSVSTALCAPPCAGHAPAQRCPMRCWCSQCDTHASDAYMHIAIAPTEMQPPSTVLQQRVCNLVGLELCTGSYTMLCMQDCTLNAAPWSHAVLRMQDQKLADFYRFQQRDRRRTGGPLAQQTLHTAAQADRRALHLAHSALARLCPGGGFSSLRGAVCLAPLLCLASSLICRVARAGSWLNTCFKPARKTMLLHVSLGIAVML